MLTETLNRSDELEEVVQQAFTAARQFQHPHVEPGHLLLALLTVTPDQGKISAEALEEESVDPDRAQAAVQSAYPTAAIAAQALSTAAQQALDLAETLATEEMADTLVCTDHLLVAFLKEPQFGVVGILTDLGVNVDHLRDDLQSLRSVVREPDFNVPAVGRHEVAS